MSKRIKDTVPQSLQKLFSKRTSPKIGNDLQFFHSKTNMKHKKCRDLTDSDNNNFNKVFKLEASCGDFEKIMQENENPLDKSSFLKTMSCSLKTSMSTATKASNSATLHSAVAATTTNTTNGPPNTTDEVFDAISMIVNNNNVLIEKDFIESIKWRIG